MKSEDSQKVELQNILSEVAEVGLDALLSEGFIKELPYISILLSFYRVSQSIKDRLLISKLYLFLKNIDVVSEYDRIEAIDRLKSDEKYKRDVGNFLIEILDRIDTHKKTEMLSKVFCAFAEKEIQVEMFYRLCTAIERIAIIDLPYVRLFYEGSSEYRAGLDVLVEQSLINAGLTLHKQSLGGPIYYPNIVCDTFVKLSLDK